MLIDMIIIGVLLHWTDITFTYIYLKKQSKYYKNPEVIELNYHKHFMKQYGLKKGTIISAHISTTIIILGFIVINHFHETGAAILIGMLIMAAYYSYVQVVSVDSLRKELIKHET